MKRWLIPCALVLYTVAIMLPPIIHGYVYPNTGDDSAIHLDYIQGYVDGQYSLRQVAASYPGKLLAVVPIAFFHKVMGWSIDTQFLWFNYCILWLVGIAVYLLAGYVTNWYAGLLSIPVVMFVGPSVLNLFDTGGIFDLMTVGIVVPLGILAFLLAMKNKKWLVPLGILVVLAVGLHSIGIFKSYGTPAQIATPIDQFLGVILGWYMVFLLGFCFLALIVTKTRENEQRENWFLLAMIVIIPVFLLFTFTRITAWATRFAVDFAIILGIMGGVMISMVVNRLSLSTTAVVVCVVVASGLPVLIGYYGYNSAVTSTDLKAIKYVNSLPGLYYSVSPTINPRIYTRFIGKVYKNGALPYIDRNKPMTSGTTEGTANYIWTTDSVWQQQTPIVPSSNDLQVFSAEGLIIDVAH